MVPQSPNLLLASLGGARYRKLLPKLSTVFVRSGDELQHCGSTRVYFPGDGLCSMRTVMRDGRVIELAAVGREGLVGYSPAESGSPASAYVQVADANVQYMLADDFHQVVEQNDALKDAVNRYSHALLQEIIQASACLRSHPLNERCARWLLVAREKIGRDQFEVSCGSIAGALGINVRKASVVLKSFTRAGAIEWDGDMLTVTGVETLEARACYCFARIQRARNPGRYPSPVSTTGNVVRLVPDKVCERCELVHGLPHVSEHDCVMALDRELQSIHIRHFEITRKRHELLQQRFRMLNEFIIRVKQELGVRPSEALRKLR